MGSYDHGAQRRNEELLQALFASVAFGNLAAAQENLLMIANAASGYLAELAAQSRYDLARPYCAPELVEAFVLPVPGHKPGMMLSGHAISSSKTR